MTIHLIENLGKVICDRQVTAKVWYPYKGDRAEIEMPAREAALRLLGDMFSHVNIYGKDKSIRALVLQRLFQYCSLPEVELQRAAKEVAHRVYAFRDKKSRFPFLGSREELLVTEYWSSDSLITQQVPNVFFPYSVESPALTNLDVSTAFETQYPVEFLLEGMRSQVKEFIETNLSEDMSTYIPVNASMSATKKEVFDLFEHTKKFMVNDTRKVLLIHGNAGSGKSFLNYGMEIFPCYLFWMALMKFK